MFGDMNAVVMQLQQLRESVDANTRESNELRQEIIRLQETLQAIRQSKPHEM